MSISPAATNLLGKRVSFLRAPAHVEGVVVAVSFWARNEVRCPMLVVVVEDDTGRLWTEVVDSTFRVMP